VQVDWQQEHLFNADPPALPDNVSSYTDFFESGHSMKDVQDNNPKWFGTFPYAYMNGSFHLGHAFTITKVEFAAGFERMRGKRVLFPVGYHATGMPIKVGHSSLPGDRTDELGLGRQVDPRNGAVWREL
jgi:leucyl-tRNA synthetase